MTTETPLQTYLQTNEPAFRKPRLAALYSDFTSLRATNPDGYNANITSWLTALSHASLQSFLPPNHLSITLSPSLLTSLTSPQFGQPLALGAVIQEGIQQKVFIPERDFLIARESVLRTQWSLNPLSLVGWGLRQLGFLQPGNHIPANGVKVVVLPNLEIAASAFTSRTSGIKGRTERLWTRQAFAAEFGDLISEKGGKEGLSDADFGVLLRFLERDKDVLSYDARTVRLRGSEEKIGITEEDTTIASLKTLIVDMETQVQVLEKRIEELSLAAKQAVIKKNRISALAALKSKRLAETTLGKRLAVMGQLEEVLGKIEQAESQVELVRVMETSSKVLGSLNKQVGGVERVDGVLEGLREEMSKVDEVGDVLAEQGAVMIDEAEVDDELEAMERVEREKVEAVEKKKLDEREAKEAEETKKRLDALEEVEKQAKRDKERLNEAKAVGDADADQGLERSTEIMKRMSLDPPLEEPA